MSELLSSWLQGGWRFANPQWLLVLWALPVLAALMIAALYRSFRIERRLGDAEVIDSNLGARRTWNTWVRVCCISLGLGLIIVAIARPQSDPEEIEVETKGRDIVFLVDVSRSMLANDVAPNRLERSKLWINDLVSELKSDRVGLVAYAGSSSVVCPLTTDRMFFRLALDELSPRSVLKGGTNIGDAIRRTMELVFPESSDEFASGYRDLIIISDGEDQESLPTAAARQASERGVRIITIGIGSDKGAVIASDRNDPRSTRVRSRLESETLRDIARESPGGVYLEVGTGTIDLAQIYADLIAGAEQRTMDTASTTRFTERYPLFLAAGLLFMLLDQVFIPTRTRRATS
jgi:Ca-activated chloride channel family protein